MKMNNRQWATYNLIKTRSEQGLETTQEMVYANYPETREDGYTWAKGKNTHDRCLKIWQDVHFINSSSEVEKIIVMDKFTYRLATEEEAEAYYDKLQEKAVKAFLRAYNVHRKIKADGQGKLISCQGNPIDDASKARPYVEAYLTLNVEPTAENPSSNGWTTINVPKIDPNKIDKRKREGGGEQ